MTCTTKLLVTGPKPIEHSLPGKKPPIFVPNSPMKPTKK